ncbi:MAG: DUF1428 domain-containing protein [Candidatus Moranbacteria bacterium]|nr:DUF1428 domain-containing protein [Candidatus Moranbacteria bacterium]
MAKKAPEYVDGYVIAVPKNKVEAYQEMATKASKIFIEHGALEVRECVAEDVKKGKLTSFPQSVLLKRNEVVIFSWVVYKSRAERDKTVKKIMTDPRLEKIMDMTTFDGARVIYGGFTTLVSASK